MRQLVILSLVAVVAGCSSPDYNGQGEYFELQNVNVIERDLSLFKPTQLLSTASVKSSIQNGQKSKAPTTTFIVRHGERYQSALIRWLNNAGYQNVAWSMGETRLAAMDTTPQNALTYSGSLKQAVSELSSELGFPIHVTTDEKNKVAGIYDFDGGARITHVKGKSIKEVTERIVKAYGLRWDASSGLSRSWIAPNDYQFGADYYLLTARDDIDTALTIVLEDYPVYSSIVESTGQVIIQEDL
ncbi:hypothetical protein [Vibrio scophthalmi]|uniref:Uncharacterized protein n=1 Tax=Vibrio scophthalmi LMG 19158 TaxID=870967 RepID=F9RN96_9VIBR|nr:hypothetical protein [Vibrio scophthalmi]EGU37241.1 hypothetical protein VIS19158_03502 [Vibrio scophthalmi LMG 19158]